MCLQNAEVYRMWLNEVLSNLSVSEIKSHNLSGLAYSRFPERYPDLKSDWVENYKYNLIRIDEWNRIKQIIDPLHSNCLVKGMSLISDVYNNPGERFMCDTDVFLPFLKDSEQKDFQGKLSKTLSDLDYYPHHEEKWYGNKFKSVYHNSHLNNTIEFHHGQLQYLESDLDAVFPWSTEPESQQLNPTFQILHLISHLSVQHTFDSLTQFIDICFYLQKYESQIDISHLLDLANILKCRKAVIVTLATVGEILKQEKFRRLGKSIPLNTLKSCNSPGVKRYLVKHFIRDSIIDAFKYDLRWILGGGYKR